MTMDYPIDEQKKIHVNPDFLSGKNSGQSNARVHVNPAFLQKSGPVQSKTIVSNSFQNQTPYPGYTHSLPSASNISYHPPPQPVKLVNSVKTSTTAPRFQLNKSLPGKNLSKYEWSRTLPPQTNASMSAVTNVYRPSLGKPPKVPTTFSVNKRHNLANIKPNESYTHISSKKPGNIKISPYSWTANKAPVVSAVQVNHNNSIMLATNKLQQNSSQNCVTTCTSVNREPELQNKVLQKEEKILPVQEGISNAKGSSILVNPKLLESIAVTNNPLLRPQSKSEIKVNIATSHQGSVAKTLNKKETPKKASKFKVISRTKLVRRQSSSGSADGSPIGSTKKSYSKNCASVLHQCSSKFPIRVRKYSTSSGLKKRYLVKSRTKLVRELSGSNSPSSKDNNTRSTKYTLKTKTRLVRRTSSNSSSLESTKKEGVASQVSKAIEKGAKFCVLSKTKLIRRRSSQGLTRSNALIRNPSAKPVKCWSSKSCGLPHLRNTENVYKVVNNGVRLSLKQKAAKGIISKYKINRLKFDSLSANKTVYCKSFVRVQNSIRPYSKQRGSRGLISKYKINRLKSDSSQPRLKRQFQQVGNQRYSAFKKRKLGIQSDHIINIGGILYKSTKTSLRKQQAKTKKPENDKDNSDSACIVHLRGDKFQVSSGGRTLKRVADTNGAKETQPSLSRVHIGGLTYSRTANGQYELTKVHQARAVLSSAKQRSVLTLSQRRKRGSLQKRNEHCIFFNRFGRCNKKEQGDCPYIHDPKRIAICTRFLRGRCPVNNCPFSHVIDPDKMPVCSHFVKASCTRENCPYRHVRVNPSAPVCLEFLQGHCTLGEECKKQHILVCEEFSTTGVCPRGTTCPLSHHRSRSKRKKSVSLEPAAGHPKKSKQMFATRKRKLSGSLDVLGGPKIKKKIEKRAKTNSLQAPQKRYFHVNDAENLNKNNESQNTTSNTAIDANPGVVSLPESLVSVASSAPQDCGIKDEEKQPTETSPSVASGIEETRKRLLVKIEKMKQTASNLELNESGVLVDKLNKREGSAVVSTDIPSTRTKSENKKIEEDSGGVLAQRPPLPKRLPSYIPLSMDGED